MLVLALYIVTVAAVKGCLVQWKLQSLEGLVVGGGGLVTSCTWNFTAQGP